MLKKGGIESIIIIVIMVAVVIGLFISAVIPMASEVEGVANTGVNKLSGIWD